MRDSSGNYSLPVTLVPSTTARASDVNANFADLGTEMAESLSRLGKGAMQAPLKLANGSPAAPAVAPSSDTDTGIYFPSSGVIAFVVNGGEVGRIDVGGIAAPPAGTVVDFAGSTAPAGWLLCYGQEVSRTDYANLFAVIGTTWGPGNGGTTFNVPDLRGRVAAGRDDMGGASAGRLTTVFSSVTLGAAAGEPIHLLTVSELPPHDHGGVTGDDTPDHAHLVGVTSLSVTAGISSILTTGTNTQTTGANARHRHGIPTQGGGGGHNNVQPTIILNKLIRY